MRTHPKRRKESITPMTRLRFAPSPTGFLHIGNARTAILNWIYAQKSQGKFILRIEDTDRERSKKSFEEAILADLKWLGLDWDEGPDIGGSFGPYRQSERLEIYAEHVKLLHQRKKAYPCFCSNEELEAKRKKALAQGKDPRYDRTCLKLSETEKQAFKDAGRQPVWRLAVRPGVIEWNDLLKGRLRFDGENLSDFILLRSDGIPTYNFAAAVDDATMKITHVVRGDDHVSNTPKQLLIYEALSVEAPQFCHIPMILGGDRARLSKRHGATSVAEYKKQGYLPHALINFLSLLSWSSESGDEILTLERLVSEFEFERMSKSPAIFDTTKLNWMNGHYLRNLSLDELLQLAQPYLQNVDFDLGDSEKVKKIVSVVRNSLETLSQLPQATEPFYRDMVQPADGQAIAISSKDGSQKIYWAFLRNLKHFDELNEQSFRMIMKQVQQETGILGKDLWVPIRVALTGQIHGPELPKVAAILGKEKCQKFIRNLID
ncbi:MAG: glutamate--tRNA ligase [bacterium]